ncbi:MAG TPA: stage II sporulation protein M [Solirubrobacteraceae bacterium]|nr:stage II sporulation protein M [Solirubrobacteraceae bacterium]
MNLSDFVTTRSAAWDDFQGDLHRAGGRPERLGTDGALEFGRRYRAITADLAYARRRFRGDPVVARLERLVSDGAQSMYGRRERSGSPLRFMTTGYWRLIAERPGPLAAAGFTTIAAVVLAALWGLHDPAAALGLVPSQFQTAAHVHLHKLPGGATTLAASAGSIFINNIQVSFLVFAGGLLLGIGSLAVLAYNGLMVGALAGITLQAGNFGIFLRYVLPHGILELSCFTVAAAAGIRLGWALIDPGWLSRGESLRRQARPAVAMIIGTAPCLVTAGLTEGFVTPHALPLPAALAVGLALGGAYWGLVLLRGFKAAHAASPTGTRRGSVPPAVAAAPRAPALPGA